MNSTELPYHPYRDTPDTLIQFLVEKDALLVERDAVISRQTAEVISLRKQLIDIYRAQFAPKSEKRPLEPSKQLPLFPVVEVAAPAVPHSPPTVIKAHTRAARTKRDLSKLPRNRIVHEPEQRTCGCCGKELSKIGEDVSQELEYQPAKLFVNEHVRPRYACAGCKDGVQQAKLPVGVKPLARSIAGAGLLSQVLVAKYVDHVPLHRQEQIFARHGFEIPRKSLCEWVGGVVEQYLTSLWRALFEELYKESYLQADETTIKVQDGERAGVCHTGYLWGVCSPKRQIVAFSYAPSRAGAVAAELFTPFTGTLQTDAYAGYHPVLLPDKVQRIACLAHVRRKFIEAEKIAPKECGAILKLIAELYGFEKRWKALSPEERLVGRQQKSLPVLQKLETYLRELTTRTLPEAPLMKAITYTLKQWTEIRRIFDGGDYQLDNNPIEREMRPIAVGRKNYLFAGSHQGATRAAVIYSLFGTARLHGVNPVQWLNAILATDFSSFPNSRISELLPHRWKLLNHASEGATA